MARAAAGDGDLSVADKELGVKDVKLGVEGAQVVEVQVLPAADHVCGITSRHDETSRGCRNHHFHQHGAWPYPCGPQWPSIHRARQPFLLPWPHSRYGEGAGKQGRGLAWRTVQVTAAAAPGQEKA